MTLQEMMQNVGEITHKEAREILTRFVNSHFNNKGEHARVSIPVNPNRDDDVRMEVYIAQQERRDQWQPMETSPRHHANREEAHSRDRPHVEPTRSREDDADSA